LICLQYNTSTAQSLTCLLYRVPCRPSVACPVPPHCLGGRQGLSPSHAAQHLGTQPCSRDAHSQRVRHQAVQGNTGLATVPQSQPQKRVVTCVCSTPASSAENPARAHWVSASFGDSVLWETRQDCSPTGPSTTLCCRPMQSLSTNPVCQ
jgi:hypothetical protein